MVKSRKKQETVAKPHRKLRIILISVTAFIGLYVIGLLNPMTGPQLWYPYYLLRCGHEPITASDFMVKSYHTPNMRGYKIAPFVVEAYYCTEMEAEADGYQKSSSLYK